MSEIFPPPQSIEVVAVCANLPGAIAGVCVAVAFVLRRRLT
jgi:hypothetical protein